MTPEQALQRYFGFSAFRGRQREAVEAALSGRSALVVMPTGQGKSLCYQLPSCLLPGLTLVISPLIALMKDQVDAARQKGLKAAFINSSLTPEERQKRHQQLERGDFQLLYVTPERFRKEEFRKSLMTQPVALLAVDEAHCISQWGHDFRPDYSRLGDIRASLGRPPTLALTATATPEVREDILAQLGLSSSEAAVIVEGIERPNLSVVAQPVYGDVEKIQWLVLLRHRHPGPGIVYFSLVSTLHRISAELRRLGVDHLIYHGQMSAADRKRQQELFLKGEAPLILATPAFGLGIDKPDVRLVVHAEVPGSVEAFYQEVGRGGRDGRPTECVLLYDEDDVSIQMDFLKWTNPDPAFIREVFRLIRDHGDRVRAEGLEYLRAQMNFYNSRDFRVETAVNLLERWDSVWVGDRGELRALQDPPEEYLNDDAYRARVKRQNEKLLRMVELAKAEGDLKPAIYTYFGVR